MIFTSNLRELKSSEQLSKIFHFSLFEKMKDDLMVMIRGFSKSKIDFETPQFLHQIYEN